MTNQDATTVDSAPPSAPAVWRPAFNPWLIAAAVMLATFMEVLDTSISAVALPHIAGSLSATTDEATWVLTSYLVSNAIILPASGWLANYFGRKRFLLGSIILFTFSSLLCGSALSLPMLIASRVIQGATGGALQPMSQAILLESFPPAKRGEAMAAFAIGVVVAPILGPTLGGWLTDNYSWRWAYYINLPVGLLAVILINLLVEDPPYLRNVRPKKIDGIGFGLMAVGLGTLQILLDKGQELDWLASAEIRWLAGISLVTLIGFIVRELTTHEPIVHLNVFANRNFAVGTFLVTMIGVILYSAITLQPLYLQTMMGYPALAAGWAVSPRGLGALLAMPVVGVLTSRLDMRKMIGVGFILFTLSMYMLGDINLQITAWSIGWPTFWTGVGMGCAFVPLATITMGDLPEKEMGNAAGLFNLQRNIGGSIGISITTTLLAREAQSYQAAMAGKLDPASMNLVTRLHALAHAFEGHFNAVEALRRSQATIYGHLLQQSMLKAYVHDFRLLAVISLVCLLCVFFLKRVKPGRRPAVH
ncbi:MAG: DHA2 family efflux MFS transporter permease subunit [Desulfobacteraceae bacterium]|nr:DHA2 family efflux MFS transporter permease subunit [Desulfobacteraceae bacterium]